MSKESCLSLCLYRMTGKPRREYNKELPNQRKDDIRQIGLLMGRDIKYKTGKRPSDKKYIEIYNTGHCTTHAVIQIGNYIIYNPYNIKDLKGTNGYIELSQTL